MSSHDEGAAMSAQPHTEDTATVGPPVGFGVVQQALRREANEQISLVNHEFGVAEPEETEVLCECVHPNCAARIVMTVADYERVRRFSTRFFVKEGHEVADEDRVVAESDGYIVIEAAGRSGLYAVGADPRRRSVRSAEVGS
jgi:hypothetical protein